MISNEERRRIAKRLRDLAKTARENHSLPYLHEVFEIIGFDYDPEDDYAITFSPDVKRLADLIDRPTCHMDLTEIIETDKGKVRVWECDECGQECEEVNGDYEYCPQCGAKVIEREVQNEHPKIYGINAKAIKRWLTDNDMTQKKLAEKIGVSQSAFGKWLQRPAEIGMGKVFALSDATGLDVHDLVVPLDDAE